MYSRELIDDILKQTDIVKVISSYITVIQKGRNYVAICPFHDDKNPSLNISKEKQIFKCFVCGTGGNAITFVKDYEKIPFEAAVRKVAELTGYHDPRLQQQTQAVHIDEAILPLYKCINDLAKYYAYGLSIVEGKEASDYLKTRNIEQKYIEKYGIGYSPLDGKATVDFLLAKGHSLKTIEGIGIAMVRSEGTADHNAGRLIFPLKDSNGQIVGFSARRLKDDGTPKYINSPETAIFHKGNVIYNYDQASGSARHDGYIYVLEGFMDVIALDKADIHSAVALMGTALTKEQIALFRRLNVEVRMCLDGDEAGQTAMMKIIGQLNQAGIHYRLVSNPNDLRDPDDILQESGPDALVKSMSSLVDPFDFQIDYYLNTKTLTSEEDKLKVINHFLPFLRNVPDGIVRENYISKLSKATGYEADVIRMETNKKPSVSQEQGGIEVDKAVLPHLLPEQKTVARLRLAERMVLYYMLTKSEAVKYFEENIDNFYDEKLYDEIANYIIEYEKVHDGQLEVSLLIADIEASGAENADEISDTIQSIAFDKCHPPYSDKSIDECKKAIDQEKERLHDRQIAENAIKGKGIEDQARIASDYAKVRAEQLHLNKKKD